MTVGELRRRMSNLEYLDWRNFYQWKAHHEEHAARVAEAKGAARG